MSFTILMVTYRLTAVKIDLLDMLVVLTERTCLPFPPPQQERSLQPFQQQAYHRRASLSCLRRKHLHHIWLIVHVNGRNLWGDVVLLDRFLELLADRVCCLAAPESFACQYYWCHALVGNEMSRYSEVGTHLTTGQHSLHGSAAARSRSAHG